jgi:hypothetical protein
MGEDWNRMGTYGDGYVWKTKIKSTPNKNFVVDYFSQRERDRL